MLRGVRYPRLDSFPAPNVPTNVVVHHVLRVKKKHTNNNISVIHKYSVLSCINHSFFLTDSITATAETTNLHPPHSSVISALAGGDRST